ncbi:unnamed protein product [Linum tenue]|uniref:Uncharacterized protein n=1 Tax=Linum tenue TaxID=586396 RepID=A0AAV0HS29_9ROSI|nr:unnamed protein product [Linum tenue]
MATISWPLHKLYSIAPVQNAIPGGHRERQESRTSPQTGLHRQRQRLARNGRPHLQLLALVDSHRQNSAMGLHTRRQQAVQGHEQASGVLQRAHDVGQMGGSQRRSPEDQSLLPGHLPNALRRQGVEPAVADVFRADPALLWGKVPCRDASRVGCREQGVQQDQDQASVPYGRHRYVVVQEGCSPWFL